MDLAELATGILAVWRVTHLLHAEDGPADVLVRLRGRLGSSIAGKAIHCFYCLSLWIALPVPFLIAEGWWERVMVWLAVSGGAILAEELAASRRAVRVPYFEAEEERKV